MLMKGIFSSNTEKLWTSEKLRVKISHEAKKYNKTSENLLQRSCNGYFSTADCLKHRKKKKVEKKGDMQYPTLKTKA